MLTGNIPGGDPSRLGAVSPRSGCPGQGLSGWGGGGRGVSPTVEARSRMLLVAGGQTLRRRCHGRAGDPGGTHRAGPYRRVQAGRRDESRWTRRDRMSRYATWLVGEGACPYLDEDLAAVPLEEQADRTISGPARSRCSGARAVRPARGGRDRRWLVGLAGLAALSSPPGTAGREHCGWCRRRGRRRRRGLRRAGPAGLAGGAARRRRVLLVDLLPERLPHGGAGVDDWRANRLGDAVRPGS